MAIRDRLDRGLRDLRVSVTDRCNLRCTYCMPREQFGPDHPFLRGDEILSFDEIARLVGIMTGLGVRKVRLTGGEPLLRPDLEDLVAMLAALDGVTDLAMTTNATLLADRASSVAAAGLDRVTVSLDALDEPTFAAVSDGAVSLDRVLAGIEAAVTAGLHPVKINAVLIRDTNEHAILDLARFGRETGCTVRFIEYMDVGTVNNWRADRVVPADEVIRTIDARFPLEPVPPHYEGEVADRYRYRDGTGEVGVIASVTRPFCGDCTRARLSAAGELFTCLFAAAGRDLRSPLRAGATDEELAEVAAATWRARTDRYSELRSEGTSDAPSVEMSYIGG